VRVLPWGEEVYLEIPLHDRGSAHKFYARHGKTAEGREFIEFSKFGAVENTENKTYSQKLRFYSHEDWQKVAGVTDELMRSIGWA
jgi:hypothetical protein